MERSYNRTLHGFVSVIVRLLSAPKVSNGTARIVVPASKTRQQSALIFATDGTFQIFVNRLNLNVVVVTMVHVIAMGEEMGLVNSTKMVNVVELVVSQLDLVQI